MPIGSSPPPSSSPQWGSKIFTPHSDKIRWTGTLEERNKEKAKYEKISLGLVIGTALVAHLGYGAYKLGEHAIKKLTQSDTRIYMEIKEEKNSVRFDSLGSISKEHKSAVKAFKSSFENGKYEKAMEHLNSIIPKDIKGEKIFKEAHPLLMNFYNQAALRCAVTVVKSNSEIERFQDTLIYLEKIIPPDTNSPERKVFEKENLHIMKAYAEANAKVAEQKAQFTSFAGEGKYGEAKRIAEKMLPKDPKDLQEFKLKNSPFFVEYEKVLQKIDDIKNQCENLKSDLDNNKPPKLISELSRQKVRLQIMSLANQILPETKKGREEFFNSPANAESLKFWKSVSGINHSIKVHDVINGTTTTLSKIPEEVQNFWFQAQVQAPQSFQEPVNLVQENLVVQLKTDINYFNKQLSSGYINEAYSEGLKIKQMLSKVGGLGKESEDFLNNFKEVEAKYEMRKLITDVINYQMELLEISNNESQKQKIRIKIVSLLNGITPDDKTLQRAFKSENQKLFNIAKKASDDYDLVNQINDHNKT